MNLLQHVMIEEAFLLVRKRFVQPGMSVTVMRLLLRTFEKKSFTRTSPISQ